MIEAEAIHINALIRRTKAARDSGLSISLSPRPQVAKQYNDELQARLGQSAFADPNSNSWYKNEAGLITNNWSDTVVTYQKKTNSIDWTDFEIGGSGAEVVRGEGKTSWKRVVEETQVSNTALLVGLATVAGVATAGTLYRRSFKGLLKT
jgi:hypothetical protein